MIEQVSLDIPGRPVTRVRVLPAAAIQSALQRPDARELLATSIGYLPEADAPSPQGAQNVRQIAIVYCVAGSGQARVAEREHHLSAGHVLVIPAGQAHHFRSSAEDPWTIYWLYLAGRKAESTQRLLTNDGARLVFRAGEDLESIALFEEIYDSMNEPHEPDHLLMMSLATGRFVSRLAALSREPSETLSTQDRIAKTVAYMQRRLVDTISVSELARMVNLSRSHYAALFKRQMGYSVLEYFIRMKMQRAADLLAGSDRPIKAVAKNMGFKDPLYFSRQFRRVHGISPTIFRSLKRGAEFSSAAAPEQASVN